MAAEAAAAEEAAAAAAAEEEEEEEEERKKQPTAETAVVHMGKMPMLPRSAPILAQEDTTGAPTMNDTQTMQISLLADRKCVACQGGTAPLKGDVLKQFLSQINPAWEMVEEHHITRTFKFRNFAEALAFVNRVGALAEEQNHHPEISFTWGKVRIELSTHKIGGLSESDMILAAKIDRL
jgi:4a-hydroxytetrahydrobiopterin dehydratase